MKPREQVQDSDFVEIDKLLADADASSTEQEPYQGFSLDVGLDGFPEVLPESNGFDVDADDGGVGGPSWIWPGLTSRSTTRRAPASCWKRRWPRAASTSAARRRSCSNAWARQALVIHAPEGQPTGCPLFGATHRGLARSGTFEPERV